MCRPGTCPVTLSPVWSSGTRRGKTSTGNGERSKNGGPFQSLVGRVPDRKGSCRPVDSPKQNIYPWCLLFVVLTFVGDFVSSGSESETSTSLTGVSDFPRDTPVSCHSGPEVRRRGVEVRRTLTLLPTNEGRDVHPTSDTTFEYRVCLFFLQF